MESFMNYVCAARGLGRGALQLATSRRFALILAGGVVVYTTRESLFYCVRMLGNRVSTWLVEKMSSLRDDNLRQEFRAMTLPARREGPAAHSHPTAAAGRTTADIGITRLIARSGYRAYSVSPSSADDREGVAGNRLFYTAKAACSKSRWESIRKCDVIKMTDVDYYVDMREYLRECKPILMYTFCIEDVAGSLDDAVYYINEDDSVTTLVTGGARYTHELWDYDHDIVTAHFWWGTVIYSVESIRVQPGRRIVGLFPRRVIYGPIGWILFRDTSLQRKKFVHGDFAVNRYVLTDGPTTEFVSISQPRLTFAATVPAALLYAIRVRVQSAKIQTPIATVESCLRSVMRDNRYPNWSNTIYPHEAAPLIAKLVWERPELIGAITEQVSLNPGGLLDYHYTPYNADFPFDDWQPSVRVVYPATTKPLITGGVAPAQCRASDESCIKGRVTETRNMVKPPPHYQRYVDEFNELLVGDKRLTGVPESLDSVYEQQNRPTQRTILDRVINYLYQCKEVVISAFQKREVYGKITHPRNISTLPGDIKARYSAYIYSLAKGVLYGQPWYAFSKTPREISARVAEVCGSAKHVVPTDFSRFDGYHCEFLCQAEESLLKAYFHESYHRDVLECARSQYNVRGRTRHGVSYDTGFTRLSGSPDTSAFNTYNNALIAYIAFRQLYTGLEGREKSFRALGIYGGDDGITPNISPSVYETVAGKLGLKLKTELLKPGEFVPFLSRYFSEAWTGGLGSFTDPIRQAQKLHLTTSSTEVTDEEVCYRKALGYLLTDPQTPILAAWSRRVVNELGGLPWDGQPQGYKDARWFEQYENADQFIPPQNLDAVYQYVGHKLGASGAEVYNCDYELSSAWCVEGLFFKTYFEIPLKVEIDAVFDNAVHLLAEKPKEKVAATGFAGGRTQDKNWDHHMARQRGCSALKMQRGREDAPTRPAEAPAGDVGRSPQSLSTTS